MPLQHDFLKGGGTTNSAGKDSAWTPRSAGLTRIRVLHYDDVANLALTLALSRRERGLPSARGRRAGDEGRENRKISGSPSGEPSPVSLSLRIKTLPQGRASNPADKRQ